MGRTFFRILCVSLVLLCLTIKDRCQAQPDSKARQQTSSTPKADLSTWQTVSLTDKGIKFKLPPDWRHDDFDLENKNENFTIQEIEWNTPNKDNPNKEMIRILTTTYHTGFVSPGGTASSKRNMLEEKFDMVTRSAQRKERDSSYSEVKKIKVGGVEGVFRILRVDFAAKDLGSRLGITWTGYRTLHGKAQEIEISISSTLKGEELLRTIFSTLEVEQDKDTPRSRN